MEVLNYLMDYFEVRIKFSGVTYKLLTDLSKKIGLPVTKVVKNIVYSRLTDLKKEGKI